MADLTAKQNQQLLKDVKAGKSQAKCAEALGITAGQLGMLTFCKAQVESGLVSKAPATEKSVKGLRAGGARWELIAAQTGLSVSKVKELVGDTAPVKRGPKASTNGGTTKSERPAAATKTNTRAAGKGGKTQPAAPARARTRAERAAKSGNPS